MIKEPEILGYTLQKWVEFLDTEEAECASKCLDYYDGCQEEQMEELLSCPLKGRLNWKERGIIPRWRNITNMVVEKSGKLFKDNPPTIEIYLDKADQPDDQQTTILSDELYKTDWLEFFNNLDSTTRLLKTSIVLVQWDLEDKALAFELLHRGNCALLMDITLKHCVGLIYQISEVGKLETYRIITQDEYIDVMEEEVLGGASKITITNRIPNPYGIIPIAIFHDTRLPRNGIWNHPGMDLISINELYNLHLTDSEYAISWSKLSTLFLIDCDFSSEGSNGGMVEAEIYGSALPRMVQAEPSLVTGPSRAVFLQSNGNGSASIEYKNPVVDIEPLDAVVQNWVEQFSYDWSVRLSVAGQGNATSGFQLVVEELPNRELRQQRAKMFNNGFRRLYQIIIQVLNTHYGYQLLNPLGDTYVEFNEPELPVDDKTNEEMWDLRINGGRASIIDYIMDEYSLTEDEAIIKAQQIKLYNEQFKQAIPTMIQNVQPLQPIV